MYLTFIKNQENKYTNQDYSINDFLSNTAIPMDFYNKSYRYVRTRTVITSKNPRSFNIRNLSEITNKLKEIANKHNKNTIHTEYTTFHIPKRSGGLREINAPTDDLMIDLTDMKRIFQYDLKVLYHDRAFAYVPGRNIKHALQIHQTHNSNWFLKLDIKNFFPNCSLEFVTHQLHKVFPFSNISEEDLKEFLWICFRNNELPQGTPMSPMLTNLIMIPIDYAITKYTKTHNLCYTRYADDILISSYKTFNWKLVIDSIETIFRTQQAPFQINKDKTRYGSSAGRNWNLGLMYNKDHNITIGYRKKKIYKATLDNLFKSELVDNTPWDISELQHFQGITSYYLSIEPEYFKNLIKRYEEKYNYTLKQLYKKRL